MQSDRRMLWIGLGVVLLVVALTGPVGPGYMGWEPAPWPRGFGFGGPPVLAFWILVVVGLILLSRNGWSVRRRHTPLAPPSAEDVLRWRYAAGEISREEYVEMWHTIQSSADASGVNAE